MKLDDLIQMARGLSETGNPSDVDAHIRAIDQYATAIAEFLTTNLSSLTKEDKEELQQLEALHGEILAQADQLKVRTGEALQRIRGKAALVLKYIDARPRRISVNKSHKY